MGVVVDHRREGFADPAEPGAAVVRADADAQCVVPLGEGSRGGVVGRQVAHLPGIHELILDIPAGHAAHEVVVRFTVEDALDGLDDFLVVLPGAIAVLK